MTIDLCESSIDVDVANTVNRNGFSSPPADIWMGVGSDLSGVKAISMIGRRRRGAESEEKVALAVGPPLDEGEGRKAVSFVVV